MTHQFRGILALLLVTLVPAMCRLSITVRFAGTFTFRGGNRSLLPAPTRPLSPNCRGDPPRRVSAFSSGSRPPPRNTSRRAPFPLGACRGRRGPQGVFRKGEAVDGFLYWSRHLNPGQAAVLFDRAGEKIRLASAIPLPSCPGLAAAAELLGIGSA